jgi:perosamine synthetase
MSSKPTHAIPLARPDISDAEVEAVVGVLRSGVLSIGPWVEEFEALAAETAGRRFGVACSSGTAGLHLAIRGLGIADGDEVITTPFSFVASANCILYERATPRFVDIEETTLGMDPALVEAASSSRTRAVLPVHVFGKPCRIWEIEEIANRRGWTLIEDACEAIGSRTKGRPVGAFGSASVFAFYPNKQITTGEGGMLVMDDEALADVARSMRNQGRDRDGTWLRHIQLGYNYRMDELSAALGTVQLRRLADLRAGRRRVADLYAARLGTHEWIDMPTANSDTEVDWFVYVVRLAPQIDRDACMEALASRGIASRPYFSPIHLQPFYRERFGFEDGDFPVAERVAASTLALPFSSTMSESDVDYVCQQLIESVAALPRRALR